MTPLQLQTSKCCQWKHKMHHILRDWVVLLLGKMYRVFTQQMKQLLPTCYRLYQHCFTLTSVRKYQKDIFSYEYGRLRILLLSFLKVDMSIIRVHSCVKLSVIAGLLINHIYYTDIPNCRHWHNLTALSRGLGIMMLMQFSLSIHEKEKT